MGNILPILLAINFIIVEILRVIDSYSFSFYMISKDSFKTLNNENKVVWFNYLVTYHTHLVAYCRQILIFIATSYILKLMCTKYEYHEVTRQPIEILNLIHMYEVMCTKIRINFFLSYTDFIDSFSIFIVMQFCRTHSKW